MSGHRDIGRAVIDGINRIVREAPTSRSSSDVATLCLDVAKEVTGAQAGFLRDDPAVPDADFATWSLPAAGEAFFSNQHLDHPPFGSLLAVPLARDGTMVGTLCLADRDGGFSQDILDATRDLAPAIAHVLADYRFHSGQARLASDEIDTLKEAKAVQEALLHELQHRVRNILTVVRSVFTRSVANGQDLAHVSEHFPGRLAALARTVTTVTRHVEGRADLQNLIRDELLTVNVKDGPSLRISGPDVAMPPKVAELLGLVIHELTTNALKYGALGTPAGMLDIAWTVEADIHGPPRLDFVWTETGVPPVTTSPGQAGFGRELIEQALPYQLGAETQLDFDGDGVSCRISLPLDGMAAATVPGPVGG